MAGNYYLAHEYEDHSYNISTNFTSFQNNMSSSINFPTNIPYYHQPSLNPQIPMVALCPQSSSLSYNNSSASDEADESIPKSINDVRKQRRMISNRESARRSRMRKLKQLDELCAHVRWLRSENHGLMEKLNLFLETHAKVIQENDKLKKETMELRELLGEEQLATTYTTLRDLDDDNEENNEFKRGDQVEVIDLGDGFDGSYYDGNIMSRVGKKTYIVQFRTLLEVDQSGFLREFVTAHKIRPKPNDVVVTDFALGQKVDVFANDGWWVGRIASKIGETEYLVHFDSTNQDIIYPFANNRVHQDWDATNDVWMYTHD